MYLHRLQIKKGYLKQISVKIPNYLQHASSESNW
jgi:hypothetical protein